VDILCLFIALDKGIIEKLDFAIDEILVWTSLYPKLLEQKRIWDLSNIFVTLLSVYGPFEAFRRYAREASLSECLTKLLRDWQSLAIGEDGLLALLDMLTRAFMAATRPI
jgi:hypothetical protein